jgi:hypothetical protein
VHSPIRTGYGRETLVVSDVEIGLGAVLGDEHLAVLEQVHGARIDVEVGSSFCIVTCRPAQSATAPEAGRGEALTEQKPRRR